MPGAFTSVCSNKHLPSYKNNIDKIRAKGVDKVFCISVNDPYVMDAWAKISKVENEIIMLADPFGDFANKLGVLVNKDVKGLGMRSSRYTMIIKNKVIKPIINTIKQVLGNNDYLMIKGSNATGLKDFSKRMIKG